MNALRLSYAIETLGLAIRLFEEERARLDAEASRLRKAGMPDLAKLAETRWNVVVSYEGHCRRMLEQLRDLGGLELET